MASKQQHIAFNQQVIAILESIGAEQLPDKSTYQFYIETKAGIMELALKEPGEQAGHFSIYCIFLNIKQAKQYLNEDDHFNRHTGKWIWHSIFPNMANLFGTALLNLT